MHSNYKAKIADTFSKYHRNYAQKAYLQKQIAKTLANNLPRMQSPKILEIGCGTGFLTRHLLDQYPDGVFDITDLSQTMVEYCQKHYLHSNAQFFVMDGEKTEVLSQYYDLIVSSMAVQWFEKPLDSLRTLNRLGPVHYATLGSNSFLEWKYCLKTLGLADGTLNLPDWPGIIREENISKKYQNAVHFLKTLKDIGTSATKQSYRSLSYSDLRRAMTLFDKHTDSHINWHIVYGVLSYK